MSNRSDGAKFERDLAEFLSGKGYWAHCMTQNVNGQPMDIIAVNRNHALLIDCKLCKGVRFPLSRVEANQWSAMDKFDKTGNVSMLVFKCDEMDTLKYITYAQLKGYQELGVSSIELNLLHDFEEILNEHHS